MNQPLPPKDNPSPISESGVRQQADNTTMSGGMQAAQGNKNIQNQGNNNWLGNTLNIFLNRKETAQRVQIARPQAQSWLLNAVKEEVENRLKQSIPYAEILTLAYEMQPEQVQHLWDVEVKIASQPVVQLPPGTKIIDVFHQGAGKLLILGSAGSGKTTTLLELAGELITDAENNIGKPIPVLANLASWKNNKQSIADWLVTELKLKYGIRQDVSYQWLSERLILPLLDGLDELEPTRQDLCIQAINQFLQEEYRPQHLVVCCRHQEYELCSIKLLLQNAICLKSLTDNQIYQYLQAANRLDIWQIVQHDSNLLESTKTPLFLSAMSLTFLTEETSFQDWQMLASSEERNQYLAKVYIQRMLERKIFYRWYARGKQPTKMQTIQWLAWLARIQQQESQTELLIEKIQPTCLQDQTQKWVYRIGVVLITGLMGELLGGILIGLFKGSLTMELILGLASGLIVGLIRGISQEIKCYETVTWSWSWPWMKMQKPLILGLMGGGIIGLILSLIGQNFGLSIVESTTATILGSIFGIIIALMALIAIGMAGPEIETKKIPNQGIWKSAYNSGIFFLATFVFLALPITQLYSKKVILPLAPLLVFSLLFSGGLACIQHFTLRLVLRASNSIPWNYSKFLNYSTKLMLLQNIGGRYQFIHERVRKYFIINDFSISTIFVRNTAILKIQQACVLLLIIFLFIAGSFLPLSLDSGVVTSTNLVLTMFPTLQNQDHLLFDKITYRFHNPKRFEIIVFNKEIIVFNKIDNNQVKKSFSSKAVRQVIGLPGDSVEFKERQVYVNNQLIDKFDVSKIEPKLINIPLDSYLVIGNNFANAKNLDFSGLVQRTNIIGRVITCYWPLHRAKIFGSKIYS